MAKSPLSRGSKQVKITKNQSNVVPLALTIPVRYTADKFNSVMDITHLAHRHCKHVNELMEGRISCLRQFEKKAWDYVNNGKSVMSVTAFYTYLQTYIRYCDHNSINAFSRNGYLSYFGNDGELRHLIKIYNPSLRLWQRKDGDEIGIKESTATVIMSATLTALDWCGLDTQNWKHLHRPFTKNQTPYKAYSDEDESMIVSRLTALFFGLAPQLITLKNDKSHVPNKLPVSIDFSNFDEVLLFPTSLKCNSGKGKINASCAFNITMGAAYHLFCYFTSLNDSVVRKVSHPLTIETDSRDKSLKTIKIRGFKSRSNQEVNALLTDEVESNSIVFNVEKRTGVSFIELLSELSTCYRSTKELLFTLDEEENISDTFDIRIINTHLVSKLHLVSRSRSLNLPWFSELFYTYSQRNTIDLISIKNKMQRTVVQKVVFPISKGKVTRNTLKISFCILSCFTDKPLKGILLPLTYSELDTEGNVRVYFSYLDGKQNYFNVPASYVPLVKDIENWAITRADAQAKSLPRFLLKVGGRDNAKQWERYNPLTSTFMKRISIPPNDFFLALQSSRFRETTSSQEYSDGKLSHLKNLLHNTLATLEKHYANGHPETNKRILSQAIQVLERIAAGNSLEQSKEQVKEKLRINMLTHDEWLKNKVITNPNGVACGGKQVLKEGKNTQRSTNKFMRQELSCSEYDMCHKCKSAKAVDEPNAIYKLISFIDVLKEALDRHPDARPDVQEKIEAFEYTLEGTSSDVLKEAMQQFEINGRHPRITINHAAWSIYR
jgi:hypothetical protein